LGEEWKPLDYQRRAVKFLLQNPVAGLFLDPGLRKTSIVLAALKILKREKMFTRALIVAPLRVCYSVWPSEGRKWRDFHDLKMVILHGKDKEKNLDKEADIYLINPEGLQWLFARNFKSLGFDILVIDESSKFKASNTKRFKLLKPVLRHFSRRYILTGSPAPNGLLDLFSQIYILDLGAALGQYISHFKHNYFYPTGYGGYEWRLQPGAEKRIQERIAPITFHLEAADYLELPKLVINDIKLQLPPAAREVYREMERELIARLERNEITAMNAAAATMKCRQIANGGVYDDMKTIHHIHDVKTEAVVDLVDELGGSPVLIAYEFDHDLKRLLKGLGKDTQYIGAGVDPKKLAKIEEAWNRGELTKLLGQMTSVAHGLNLQEGMCSHVAFHSLTYNFELYTQFFRRVLRSGNKAKKVVVHRFIMEDTVDEAMVAALEAKDRTERGFLHALKRHLFSRRTPT